ncbi:hypothetical protein C5Z25_03650 [Lactobacillus sp. CBA3605]|uniref:MFS transporter n=1 Tax=Lactobacillus sp. CBA3605 TaxID=2099788 RepID=UPI000CFBFAD9|nr:MFS transporter [Lactobacillus sp. CBA3605]AVK60902.1 hypothetical protein C5Z25_03650 [Lactobacillus sp. CBA3605]
MREGGVLDKKRILISTTFFSDFSNAAIIYVFTLSMKGEKAIWFSLLWGMYYFGSFLSHLLMGLFIDRIIPKKAMFFSEIIRLILVGVTLILLVGNAMSGVIYVAIMTLIGLAEPIFHPAEIRLIYHYFSKSELTKVNSVLELSDQLMSVIAPIVLLFLSYSLFHVYAYGLIIVVLLISLVFISLLPDYGKGRLGSSRSGIKAKCDEMLSGYQYILKNNQLLVASVTLLITNLAFGIVSPLLLPLIQQGFSMNITTIYTAVSAFESVGLLVSAYLFLRLKKMILLEKKMEVVSYISTGIIGLCLLLIGSSYHNVYLIAASYFSLGLVTAIFNILNNLNFQFAANDKVVGKVYAFKGLITVLGFVLGTIIGGLLSEKLAINDVFRSTGLMLLVPIVLFFTASGFEKWHTKINTEK